MGITRRTLAKGLAAGAAAGFSGLLQAEENSQGPAGVAVRGRMSAAEWNEVHPGVWRATFGTPERFTPVAMRQVPPEEEAFSRLPKVSEAPLSAIEGFRTDRGYVVQLPLRANEQVFGFGLQLLSFAQRGKKKTARVNADPKVDTGDSHAPVPFYVTTEGIGVLVDTARYATFYFGDARPKPMHSLSSVEQANPDPVYTHDIHEGDKGQITVEVPHAEGVDVYLFAGPEMLDAVKRYNVFSGGGALPPDWGLGFWYRMDARATQETTLAMAREFKERKIPCDVLGLEPGWQTHAYSCTFAWNKDRFPDPKGFVKSAGEMNYRVNLWEHAFTHPASPMFPEIEPHSGNFGVWGGLVPDFAGKPAREAFGSYHGRNLMDIGISGFKLDECDNSDFTGGWSFPECSSFPSGLDGEQMHSLFGLGYQQALWNAFKERNLETYGLVRSSGALAAPYPFVLYSDLYDHREFIRALVNSGFSGLLWCPEVRQAASEEDLIRRLQSTVFSPLAQVDCWYMKSPPWKQIDRDKNNAGELMEHWERLEERCREIIGWRMQMGPYLKEAFHRYKQNGTPPFRALVLDNAKDSRFYKVDDQYMIGDRMMVAPLFAGEPSRRVVLPAGPWHDFWSGDAVDGGRELTITAATEKIPIYVKSGSIIPWADVGMHTSAPECRRITARVYGDGSIPFVLDDGKNKLQLNWKNGRGDDRGTSGYDVYAWKKMG